MEWDELDALADAVADRWGPTEELLAVLVEMLDGFRLMWASANSEKGTNLPDPVQVPRPGRTETKQQPVAMSPREFGQKWRG